MDSIFNKYYNDEVYDLDSIRSKPLTWEELREEKFSEEDIQKYFSLVKSLYCECVLFNTQPSIGRIPPDYYKNNIASLYKEYLNFCALKGLISIDFYRERLDRYQRYHNSLLLDDVVVVFERFPNYESEATLQSIEDFRFKLEEDLTERSFDWYLALRYGVYCCFDSHDEDRQTFLYRHSAVEKTMVKLSCKEAGLLLQNIKEDLSNCDVQEKEIEEAYKAGKYYGHSVIDELNKLFHERQWLEECEEIVEEKVEELREPVCTKEEILYIYKGNISCRTNSHNVIPATAILYGKNDCKVELNVEFCTDCNKYLLEYSLFERYRERYGVLIGNLRMVTNGSFDGEYDLALESPLRLSGYNVNQQDDFSSAERHYILARIIHDGVMSKNEVIRYLSYFIRMNGARRGNDLAVDKWEEDLDFVQKYDINMQPKVAIKEIQRY